MGQRLNVEIHSEGEVIANAYYHWSAYTGSSLMIAKTILENINEVNETNEILYAIRLLETTGALLTDDEIIAAKKLDPEAMFDQAMSRSDGLIAITQEGIENTRRWEEGRVEIDLDEREVIFDVLHFYDKDEYMSDYDETEESYKNMIVLPFHYSGDPIPFSKFDNFATEIINLISSGTYHVRLPNSDEILAFVE